MSDNTYYFEDISSVFRFGRKYKGLPLSAVIAMDPSYLYWCINTISYFCISNTALKQIRELFPTFIVTESFYNHIDIYDGDYYVDEEDDYYEDNKWHNYEDETTYERYAGTYAQDEMGWSDDDIDNVLDGEPDAYWNID